MAYPEESNDSLYDHPNYETESLGISNPIKLSFKTDFWKRLFDSKSIGFLSRAAYYDIHLLLL